MTPFTQGLFAPPFHVGVLLSLPSLKAKAAQTSSLSPCLNLGVGDLSHFPPHWAVKGHLCADSLFHPGSIPSHALEWPCLLGFGLETPLKLSLFKAQQVFFPFPTKSCFLSLRIDGGSNWTPHCPPCPCSIPQGSWLICHPVSDSICYNTGHHASAPTPPSSEI